MHLSYKWDFNNSNHNSKIEFFITDCFDFCALCKSCLLIYYFIPSQLIPLTITLLEAFCLISLLPSLRPLLDKDVLPINYHFYEAIYQLIINRFLIYLNLKQHWKTICCQDDWLSDFDINDSWLWLLTVDSHGASTLLARLQCTLAPPSSMGVIFFF